MISGTRAEWRYGLQLFQSSQPAKSWSWDARDDSNTWSSNSEFWRASPWAVFRCACFSLSFQFPFCFFLRLITNFYLSPIGTVFGLAIMIKSQTLGHSSQQSIIWKEAGMRVWRIQIFFRFLHDGSISSPFPNSQITMLLNRPTAHTTVVIQSVSSFLTPSSVPHSTFIPVHLESEQKSCLNTSSDARQYFAKTNPRIDYQCMTGLRGSSVQKLILISVTSHWPRLFLRMTG